MEVHALFLCEQPIGISGFQKEALFQNSTPLVEFAKFASPRWCSCKSKIYGEESSKEVQVLISFCLEEFLPRLLTFSEAIVRGLLSI
jgi:hypothetical protein